MKTVQVFLLFVLYHFAVSTDDAVCKIEYGTLECSNFKTADMENLNPSLITATDNLKFVNSQFDYIPVEFFTPFEGKLKKITTKNCGIKRILENNFMRVPELTSIDLSDNEINEIKPEMFSGLTKLKILSLNRNNIDNLDKNFFKNLLQLEIINLSNNKLNHFDTDFFMDLGYIRYLDVSDNPINGELHLEFQSIKHFVASSCGLTKVEIDGKIQELGVARNPITEIKVSSDSLHELVVAKTLMHNVCTNIKCENLISLSIAGCPVDYTKLEEEFKLMPNLQKLRLGETNISILDKKLLEPLEKLTHLDLSQNNLLQYDLELLTNLEFLGLSHTNISTLEKKTLEPLKKLKILDISHNNLSEVDLDVFTQLNLDTLVYTDNPWKCSTLNPLEKEYVAPNRNRSFSTFVFRSKPSCT